MMDEGKWLIWVAVVVCITAIIISLSLRTLKLDEEYIKNGYSKVLVPTAYRAEWSKVGE